MPISTPDYLAAMKAGWQKDLYQNLYRMNPVTQLFPVAQVGAPKVESERWDILPSASTHGFYEEPAESTGSLEPYEDSLGMFGSKWKEEREYDQWSSLQLVEDPMVTQYKMHQMVVERTVANYIFNGDLDTDPKGFNGLYARFQDGDFVANNRISLEVGGTTTLVALASAANAQLVLDGLDEAIYRTGLRGLGANPKGQPRGAFFMNYQTLSRFKQLVRLTGLSTGVVDLYEKTYDTYMGIPMIDVGFQADQTTEIIGNDYTLTAGTGTNGTRIYLCRFATPTGNVKSVGSDGLNGITNGGLRRLAPYQVGASLWEHSLRWQFGIAHPGDDYAAAVIEGFRMATV